MLLALVWPMTTAIAQQAENEQLVRNVWYQVNVFDHPVGLVHARTVKRQAEGETLYVTTQILETSLLRFGQKFAQKIEQRSCYSPNGEVREITLRTESSSGQIVTLEWFLNETGKLIRKTPIGKQFLEEEIASETPFVSESFIELMLTKVAKKKQNRTISNVLFAVSNRIEQMHIEYLSSLSNNEVIVLQSYFAAEPEKRIKYWYRVEDLSAPYHMEAYEFGQTTKIDRINFQQVSEIRGRLGTFDVGNEFLVAMEKTELQSVNPHQLHLELTRDAAIDWLKIPTDLRQQVISTQDEKLELVTRNQFEIEQAGQEAIPEIKPSRILASSPDIQQWSNRVVTTLQDQHSQVTSSMIVKAMRASMDDQMKSFNYASGFETAAQVAVSKQGDCTEYAVLLAALLREQKIPARVAFGLIYSPALNSFSGHMWTEAYCESGWVMVDASQPATYPKSYYIKYGDHFLANASQPGILEIFNHTLRFNRGLRIRLLNPSQQRPDEAATK